MEETKNAKNWINGVIKQDEIDKYLINGEDYINEEVIERKIAEGANPDKQYIRDIIQKSLTITRLDPEETAALMAVEDEELWQEIFEAGGEIKRKVYDNRIVTFAPLYCSNLCVNNCHYCGFRTDNEAEKRRILTMEEIREEARSMSRVGHKRTIAVFGEHPSSDINYMEKAVKAIYEGTVEVNGKEHGIRRVNINAAPMSIADLKRLWKAGIGTYQVFQETYNKKRYAEVHPAGTLKGNYRWRLYTLHRALEAGIDDVASGALFGLYDWRFEVMGLLYQAIDLEKQFDGLGPHTISFPRLMAAGGADVIDDPRYKVSDEDFKKLVAVIRLTVPYTGLIITARESAQMRREVIPVGCTQTDASTKIGVGSYSEQYNKQEQERQQFILGDTRSLDEVIREFADMGLITSFCTAGYRCGRTGDKIMGLLKSGTEGKFCKLNGVLTFREWLDDFASPETKAAGEKVIAKELGEIKGMPFYKESKLLDTFLNHFERIKDGERDIYI